MKNSRVMVAAHRFTILMLLSVCLPSTGLDTAMSKLDRHLDKLRGEGRVEIQIAAGEEIDVGRLHQLLRNEIDARQHRIPVDLRKVHGAPEALVDVLIESQKYARSQGKILSVSYALPPMQEALNPIRRRMAGKSAERLDGDAAADASQVAKELIDQCYSEEATYDTSKAEKIQRKKKPANTRSKGFDYLLLGSVILSVTMVIAAIEWAIVFNDQPDAVIIPAKTFESVGVRQGP